MDIDAITPRPKSRSFIVASVGSGKSTLGGALLESYRRQYPAHRLALIDPKRRFFGQRDKRSSILFPAGTRAQAHGRREGVTVNARTIGDAHGFNFKDDPVLLIQSYSKASEFFNWLFDHHDVRRPWLVYCDESFDFMRGTRADPSLRRLIQMGREMGIGTMIVNQRPAWIDGVLLTESDRLYVGQLHGDADRKRMADITAMPDRKRLLIPVPRFHWWMLDQINPSRSLYFRLGGVQ